MCKKPLTKIFPAAIAVLILSFSTPAQAQSGDEAFFSVRVDPNIVILLDNSGSMYHLVWHENYNDATAYTGAFTSDRTYYLLDNATSLATFGHAGTSPRVLWWYSGGWQHMHSDATGQFTSGGRTVTLPWPYAGAMPSYDAARFKGNYLNWIFNSTSGASAADIASLPQQTRIQVAQQVINNLIDSLNDVRLAIYRLNRSNGRDPSGCAWGSAGCTWESPPPLVAEAQGGTRVYDMTTLNASTLPATRTAMKGAVNAITASTWTPLSEALYDVWLYYTTGGANPPIQYSCQKSFVIVVTDGLPTFDGDTGYIPASVRDQTTLPGYDTPNNTGCTTSAEGCFNYLENVARYMYSNDARSGGSMSGLQNVMTYTVGFSINTTLLQNAATNGGGQYFTAQTSSQLASAILSAITDISNQATSFTSPTVPTLRATEGGIVYEAKFVPSTTPFWRGELWAYEVDSAGDITSVKWEAGLNLSVKDPATRSMYTTKAGSRTTFTFANLTNADLGVSTDADRTDLVDYVRGVGETSPGTGTCRQTYNWKLQDIFHSSPVIVGPPSPYITADGYSAFYEANKTRQKVILVGANDGMLHAFKAVDGDEAWAWIPPDQLTRLRSACSTHTYFVDSPARVADVKIGANWTTLAIIGERTGGDRYMALDITNTLDPQWKWNFTDGTYMGQTWSRPAVGKVKIGANDVWVAFVTGGYDTANAPSSLKGKAIYVVRVSDGTVLYSYTYNSDPQMRYPVPTPPIAVDINNNGYVDRVYFGDVGNNMWRLDVSADTTGSWSVTKLFDASAGVIRPIFTEATASFDQKGRLWIYFGTGDRINPMDANAQEKVYAIIENKTSTPTFAINDLENISSSGSTFTDDGSKQGWYINLTAGEKMLTSPTVFNEVLLFTTFNPTGGNDPCAAGGTSSLYALDFTSGAGLLGGSARSTSLGAGFVSAPTVSVTKHQETGEITTNIFVSSAAGGLQVVNVDLPPLNSVTDFLFWRDRRLR